MFSKVFKGSYQSSLFFSISFGSIASYKLKETIRMHIYVHNFANIFLKMSSITEALVLVEQDVPLDLSSDSKKVVRMDSSKRHRQLPCDLCGKSFDRPSLLKRHIRTHTGEKPHGCSVCGKMFSTSSSLNTHARIHTGERPHECLICGKRFTASSNLYYHRMTHYKEKPHKCNDCERSFATPGDLKAHSYSHTGNWPLRCHICYRGFCKTRALHHHIQLHKVDRTYQCKFCSQQFSMEINLHTHEYTHLAEQNIFNVGFFHLQNGRLIDLSESLISNIS